ncbi:unnamed protein product [Microthlaspi erraticum]|uniref:Uncharacterized protein n=1 Tax=Microthlaspi erraticum TaxID=1685480 RepID=A0A6D2KNH1_9BRAS|nr:unnamed protein product [Microthlaspi erraticum]
MWKDMHALNSKLDKLIMAQFPPKHVNYVSGKALIKDQEGEEKQHEICYIQNKQGGYRNTNPGYQISYGQQGTYNSYSSNLQNQGVPPGFVPMPHHTPPSQIWDMKEMLQQLLQGQTKGSLEMNHKLVEINSKLESLTSRVQIIESSSASSSSPQEYAQAVTLRSGRQLPNRVGIPKIAVDIDDQEGEDLVEYADIPAPNSIELEHNMNQSSIELKKPKLSKTNQSSIEPEEQTDKATSSQPTKPVGKKKDTPSGPPPYKPPLPFPGRFKKQLLESTRLSLMN